MWRFTTEVFELLQTELEELLRIELRGTKGFVGGKVD